jgi:hypothetical protein
MTSDRRTAMSGTATSVSESATPCGFLRGQPSSPFDDTGQRRTTIRVGWQFTGKSLALAAGVLSAAIGLGPSVRSQTAVNLTQVTAEPKGDRGFDFQRGEWRVHHRVKRAGQSEWTEFDGTCRNRSLIDGSANVEEHTFVRPGGITYGIAMRAYDPKSERWAIWWVDSRDPHGALDPPVKGHFEDGVGTFYSDYVADGKTMRVRFVWSHITPKSARWEQASSSDAGKTWEINWIMEFERVS